MLYEILCLLIAAFAVYGFYHCLRRLLFGGASGDITVTPAWRFTLTSTREEAEEALEILRLRANAMGGEDPVLLVDCPVRREVLHQLSAAGAEIYLSYEEYYEKRNKGPLR